MTLDPDVFTGDSRPASALGAKVARRAGQWL